MSVKFLSVDINWLSLNSKAIYCKDDGYTSKRREWGGIDEPVRKGKMTGNNRAWELLPAAGCGPFPQDIGGPVPFRLLPHWNFKSLHERVNWVHFGRGAYPCASQLWARKWGLLHRCDHQAPTPGVREYSQKRETDVNPVAFAVCAHYSHSGELCVIGREHVRGRRDLRGRCGIYADPPWHTISCYIRLSYLDAYLETEECYRDVGGGWR